MLFQNVVCPISQVKIDSRVSRVTSFINSLLIALYVLTGSPFFIVAAALDFSVRAFGKQKFSPVRLLSITLAKGLHISGKKIVLAPKIFASRVGFLFSAASLTLFVILLPKASLVVAAVLLVFTLMDSLLDFCVGCLMYHYVVLPFYTHRNPRS